MKAHVDNKTQENNSKAASHNTTNQNQSATMFTGQLQPSEQSALMPPPYFSVPLQRKTVQSEQNQQIDPINSKPTIQKKSENDNYVKGIVMQAGSLRLYSEGFKKGKILADVPEGTEILIYKDSLKENDGDNVMHITAMVNGVTYDGYCSGHPSEIKVLEAESKPAKAPPQAISPISFESDIDDYENYIRSALGMSLTGVGQANLGMKLNFGAVGQVLKGAAEVSLGGLIEMGIGIGIADDRRLRVTGKLGLGGYATGSLLWDLIEVQGEIKKTFHITGIYESPKHLAAHIFSMVCEIAAVIVSYGYYNPVLQKLTGQKTITDKVVRENFNPIGIDTGSATEKSVGVGTGDKINNFIGSEINYKHSWIDMDSNVKGRKGETEGESGKATVKLPKGIGVEVTVTKTRITNDANPDNDGDYMNARVFMYGVKDVDQNKVQSLYQKVINGYKGVGAIKDLAQKFCETIAGYFKKSFKGATYEGDRRIGVVFEGNSVKSGDAYQEQYSRISFRMDASYKKEMKTTVGTGVIGGGLEAGVELTADFEASAKEFLGTNTMTYASTVYNGYMNRKKPAVGRWNAYRGSHFGGLVKIAQKLGIDNSVPTQEYIEWGLKTAEAERFRATCKKYAHSKNLPSDIEAILVSGLEKYILAPQSKKVKQNALV